MSGNGTSGNGMSSNGMSGKMRIALAFLGITVALAALFLLIPSPVDPLAYEAPIAPALEGAFAPNHELQKAQLISLVDGHGPEGLALDDHARIVGGLQDGRIVRFDASGKMKVLANTQGRPLGLQFDAQGNLIICDAYKGLLSLAPDGTITVLSKEAEGVPFLFTDDLDIAADGRIYFSDASSRFVQRDYLYDLLEARPHGRLLRYDPRTGKTEVLLRDLYFANGVALAADDSFVLVHETYRYRIKKLWLKGERSGQSEIFMENLPGFPDNITRAPDGNFWVALFTVRKAIMDDLFHPHPTLKKLLAKLPRFAWPKPAKVGLVFKVDSNGKVLESLHDPEGKVMRIITSALEKDGKLYLGSLHEAQVGILELAP
jgi:sugar lactone lactonase YvrE